MTIYLYDRLNAIIERNWRNDTAAYYTRGLSYGGGIGSIISAIRGNDTHYYHDDGIGGVTGLTDSTGKTVQTYVYDAYGNVLRVDSYLKGKQTMTNPYGFSTKEYNSKSGLIYFGARYYDPKIGRFITPDPIRKINDPNLYIYCSNNPTNYIDPFGFLKEKHWWKNFIEGRYFGTGYGKEATEWYAQRYVETGKWYYFVGGSFAAL